MKDNGAARPHLFVGIPSIDGRVTVELRRYLTSLEVCAAMGTLPFTVSTAEVTGIAPVEYARNVLCGMALSTPADRIVLIDADMKPEPTASRVLFSQADITVPRMYRFRHHGKNGIHQGPPELAACATVVRDGARLDLIPEFDAKDAHRVDACGTGFIMIRRHVLDDPRMRVGEAEDDVPAIFRMTRNAVGRITEWEDFDFSFRASRLGYVVVVDFAARCGHSKTLDLDSVAELAYTKPERGEIRTVPPASIMDRPQEEDSAMRRWIYTEKAERDGLGKAGDVVPDVGPSKAYLDVHGYAEELPDSGGSVETGEVSETSDGAVRRTRKVKT